MKVINRNGFFSPPSSKRNLAPSLSDQELIKLINNLSSVIKKYYVSTKASLSEGKEAKSKNANGTEDKETKNDLTLEKIEFELKIFLSEAKKIFQQLKLAHQKNTIRQEVQSPLFKMPTSQINSTRYKQQLLSPQKGFFDSGESKTRNCDIGIPKKDDINNLSNSINNNFNPPLLLSEKSLELANKVIEFLKELNPIQESVFNKKWDAEEKKKLFDKMKDDLYNLINNILSSNPQIVKSSVDINNILLINKNNNFTGSKNSFSGTNSKKPSKPSSKAKSKPKKDYDKLESLLSTKEFLIQELNNDIKIKNETIHRNNSTIANLKTQLQNMQNDITLKNDLINNAKNIKQKDENNVFKAKTLQNEIEKIKGINIKLKSQCDNYQNLLREKEERIRGIENKNKELVIELRNASEVSDKNMVKIQNDIKKNSDTIKSLEKEIKQKDINYKEQISFLNGTIEKNKKIIDELTKTKEKYEKQIQIYINEIDSKKKDPTNENTINILKLNISQYQHEIETKDFTIKNYIKEINDLKLSNKEINDRLSSYIAKDKGRKSQVEIVDQLKKEIESKDESITVLNGVIKGKDQANYELNQKYMKVKKEMNSYEEQNALLVKEIEEKKKELEKANEAKTELCGKIEQLTLQEKNENGKISEVKNSYETLQLVIKEKTDKINQLERNIVKINSEYKQKEEEYKKNIDLLLSEKSIIESEYKKKIDDIRVDNTNKEIQNKKTIEEIENEHAKKIKEKEDDIVNLKQNLEKLIKENKDTMQSNDELNKLIQSHKNTIDDLKKDIDNEKDKYQKTIDALTQEKNKIIKEKEQLIIDRDNNIQQCTELKKQLDDITLYNNNLKQDIKGLIEEVSKFKEENKSLQEKKENKIEILKNLEQPIKSTITQSYSNETHRIITDKNYNNKYHWLLLAPKNENEISYQTCIWVSEDELKPTIDKYNRFKSEREIEQEQINEIENNQKIWIQRLEEKEDEISRLKMEKKKSTNLTASFGTNMKNKLFELNLVTKESDKNINNVVNQNNSIPIEKYQTVIEELNDANLRLAQSKTMIDKLQNENKELSKIKDDKTNGISFINGGGNETGFLDDDNFEIPEMKEIETTNHKNTEINEYERRLNQIKSLLQLLIHEMDLNKKTKKILTEICNISGFKEEETQKFLSEKEKKGGFKGLFKKKEK